MCDKPVDSVRPWKFCPQRRDNGQCECDDQPCPGNDCEFASAHWRGVDEAVKGAYQEDIDILEREALAAEDDASSPVGYALRAIANALCETYREKLQAEPTTPEEDTNGK